MPSLPSSATALVFFVSSSPPTRQNQYRELVKAALPDRSVMDEFDDGGADGCAPLALSAHIFVSSTGALVGLGACPNHVALSHGMLAGLEGLASRERTH